MAADFFVFGVTSGLCCLPCNVWCTSFQMDFLDFVIVVSLFLLFGGKLGMAIFSTSGAQRASESEESVVTLVTRAGCC